MNYYQLLVTDPSKESDLHILLQVPTSSSSYELYDAIRQACQYEEDMIGSLLLCDSEGHPYLTLLSDDLFLDEFSSQKQKLMKDCTVEELMNSIHEKELHLLFIYDFFQEKGFEITCIDTLVENNAQQQGIISVVKGTPPKIQDNRDMAILSMNEFEGDPFIEENGERDFEDYTDDDVFEDDIFIDEDMDY